MRIGSFDDPEVGFSRIGGVGVAADGRLVVLEAQDRHVRVSDPDGRPIRRIGGPGQGPGELTSPTRVQVVGDTVVVVETSGNARITLYSLEGDVLAMVPTRPVVVATYNDVPFSSRPGLLRPDGYFDGIISRPATPLPEATDSVRVPRLRFDFGGQPVDTAFHPPVTAAE